MYHLCYRICFYLMITLTCPILHLSSISEIHKTNSEMKMLKGNLKNGFGFLLIPSTQLKGGISVQMNCNIPLDEENSMISRLTQDSLFYGTQVHKTEELFQLLNGLGLDVEPDSYVHSDEKTQSIHFCLSSEQAGKIREILEILHLMTFFPSLKNEEIELARNHLLTSLEGIEKDPLPLQSITADELRLFHAQWYRPENLHLTLVGMDHPAEICQLLSEIFGSSIDFIEEIPLKESSSFMDLIELNADNQSFVVDGKILMKEPNWINKSVNGKTLGTILTILGIGGLLLALPVITPVAIIAGSLTAGTGLYFLTCDYLKDPYYVEKIRQTDLQQGCAYAYRNHRVGITLTPYERRVLFLQEMIQYSNQPILLLADLYQLNDPVMAEIFTNEELNVLIRIKCDFIQQRNQYKMLQYTLEQELATLTAPYALVRDAALLNAQEIYQQNYYVISKKNLKVTRDSRIEDFERAYRENMISLKEKQELIEKTHAEYQACLSDRNFKEGLELAESNLTQMQLEIQANYAYQVELCKQSIQYYTRLERIKLGKQALSDFFNQELVFLLPNFPVSLASLPDYLDLRNL